MNCTKCNDTGFINADQIPREYKTQRQRLFWLDNEPDYSDDGCSCCTHPMPPCGWCENAHEVDFCECLNQEAIRLEAWDA